MAKATVTVITLTRSESEAEAVIKSLNKKNLPIGFSLLVVVNGAPPQPTPLPTVFANGQYLRLSEHRSISEAINLAVEVAETDFVLISSRPVVGIEIPEETLQILADSPKIAGVIPLSISGEHIVTCGGYVSEQGAPLQLACGTPYAPGFIPIPSSVDFGSSFGFLCRRKDFIDVDGFSENFTTQLFIDIEFSNSIRSALRTLLFEPAFRLALLDVDKSDALRATSWWPASDQLSLNQAKTTQFAGNNSKSRNLSTSPSPRTFELSGKRVGLYTPFPIYAGGGERYLLSALLAIKSSGADTVLIAPRVYSRARLTRTLRALGLSATGIEIITPAELAGQSAPLDLFISMGNGLTPPIPAQGIHNIYHCQFPFASASINPDFARLGGYEKVVVNSSFTAAVYRDRAKGFSPEVEVLYPPVPQKSFSSDTSDPFKIVSIGRFFIGDHSKNQDLLIAAFSRLHAIDDRYSLTLIGSVAPGHQHRDFAEACLHQARGLPITFLFEAPEAVLDLELSRSSIYWHAAGLKVDVRSSPEKAEHFGIAVAEAMSAGVIPFAVNSGGPAEFIDQNISGFLYATSDELVRKTLNFNLLSTDAQNAMRLSSIKAAKNFSETVFSARVKALVLDSLEI